MKNVKALLIALILAVLATVAQCRYVKQSRDNLLELSQEVYVWKAIRDIPENTSLDSEDFVRVKVPKTYRQPGAISSGDAREDIVRFKGHRTIVPIAQGEQLLSNKLFELGADKLSSRPARGYRAVAIYFDDTTAVGGHINPYDHVDILGTFDFSQGDTADMRTTTLFEYIKVLSVGNRLHAAASGDDAATSAASRGYAISFELLPEEAQKLVLANSIGDLTLTLRGKYDKGRCNDNEDNDGDGKVDSKDPMCAKNSRATLLNKEIKREGEKLEAVNVKETLRIPEKVRRRARRQKYGVYGPGSY